MQRGWLIVNAFLKEEKFRELYQCLLDAAANVGVVLQMRTNVEVLMHLDALLEAEAPQFALFWDKDETLAWLLEAKGLRLFNPSSAIVDCDNKALTYARLIREQIPMPKTIPGPMTYARAGYRNCEFAEELGEQLGFPLVAKECYGSFGAQVYLVPTVEELKSLLQEKVSTPMIFQEFLAHTAGRDVRLYMVGETCAAAIERRNDKDFRANVAAGGTAVAYQPTKEEVALAQKACKCLKLEFGGVDILWDRAGNPLICEVNSNAHFRGIMDATGVPIAEKILSHIQNALES